MSIAIFYLICIWIALHVYTFTYNKDALGHVCYGPGVYVNIGMPVKRIVRPGETPVWGLI